VQTVTAISEAVGDAAGVVAGLDPAGVVAGGVLPAAERVDGACPDVPGGPAGPGERIRASVAPAAAATTPAAPMTSSQRRPAGPR
jgi:hypothetical protein